MDALIAKYNIAVPRYTSYPTVPLWEEEQWRLADYTDTVKRSSVESQQDGISLYVHLPYCESLCTYCACNTRITRNHLVETPYIEAVLKEWEMYKAIIGKSPIISELHFGGGTPTFFSPENLRKLTEGLLQGCELSQSSNFSFEGHPANTSREHLDTLYSLGFRRVSYGIQDFDPVVQDVINRKQSLEQVQAATKNAREAGYTSVNFDLIYGLPLQTLASITDTVQKVIDLMPDRIAFYSYAHVPWVKPGQRKFSEADLPQNEVKLSLYQKGRKMLLEAGYFDIGMDHFALPGDNLYKASKTHSLHRNFMGYTDQYTQLLIGLGVSSISDTWYGFAQNVKQVESYIAEINKGNFPLVKGHLLTTDDLIYRRHILNLMCNGFTLVDFSKQRYQHVRKRLIPLQQDNLIEVSPKGRIDITQTGKAFIRNICRAFDERFWQQKAEMQLFSKAI